MTILDYALLLLLAWGGWHSYRKGLFVEVIDLLQWIVAWILLTLYLPVVTELWQPLVAEAVLAANMSLVAGTWCFAWALKSVLRTAEMVPQVQHTDRILGVALGLVRMGLILIFILTTAGLTTIPQSTLWRESQVVDYFLPLAQTWVTIYPQSIVEQFQWVVDFNALPGIEEEV